MGNSPLTSEMLSRALKQIKDLKTTYVAQFAISKDRKNFELKYSGVKMSGTNKDSGKYFKSDSPDEDTNITLERIYQNQPEGRTWGLLFGIGRE